MNRFVRIGMLLLVPIWLGGCSLKITLGNPGDSETSTETASVYNPSTPVYLESYPGVQFYEWYNPGCGCFVYVRYFGGWWVTQYGVRVYHGHHLAHHTPPANAFAGRHPQHRAAPAGHAASPAAHPRTYGAAHQQAPVPNGQRAAPVRAAAPHPQVGQPRALTPPPSNQGAYRRPAPAAPQQQCHPRPGQHC